MSIPFTKMQSLGNDFVVIDNIAGNIPVSKELVCKIANRNFGVGCDQVLVLESANQPEVDFCYRIFNVDGSEAKQCGNGVRCLAKLVAQRGLSKKRNLVFGVGDQKVKVYLEDDGLVSANIGKPVFEPKDIPFVAEHLALRYNLVVLGYDVVEAGVVSVGNPHAVVLVDSVDNAPVMTLGLALAKSTYFPEGTNVDFMRIVNRNQIELRVYERGSGETLACGSGACASVVIGRLWQLLDEHVEVKMSGGNLSVRCNTMEDDVQVTGPADIVFVGEIF